MRGAEALLWTIGRDPVLRSTVVAVLVLDRAPDDKELADAFVDLTAVVPRLTMRVVPPRSGVGRPRWDPVDRLVMSQHLHRLAAPSPGDLRSVLDVAQAMAGTAFDPELPLWEALLVEGLEEGRGALVVKLHHSVVDGVGGLQALFAVAEPEGPHGRAVTGKGTGGLAPVHALRSAGRLVGSGLDALRRPGPTAAGLLHGAATAARLLVPTPTPLSPAMRERGQLRQAVVLDVPTADLHDAARRVGASVNDVFVSAVLDALERYHAGRGAYVRALRGTIPVNIRGEGDVVGSNRFVPARFVFPLVATSTAARVRSVHRVMHGAVHDSWLVVSDLLAEGLARLPAPLATAAFGSMLKGADFIATNMRGPVQPLQVAGATVERVYALAPPAGAAFNVALVTVGDVGCVGDVFDRAAVADPDALTAALQSAFAEVSRLAAFPGRARRPHRP